MSDPTAGPNNYKCGRGDCWEAKRCLYRQPNGLFCWEGEGPEKHSIMEFSDRQLHRELRRRRALQRDH